MTREHAAALIGLFDAVYTAQWTTGDTAEHHLQRIYAATVEVDRLCGARLLAQLDAQNPEESAHD